MDISRALRKLANRFPDKRVLVTGATSGLGEALAIEFASAGWRVAVTGRSVDKAAGAAALVTDNGGEPLSIVMEVNRPEGFDTAFKQVNEAWGGLDILINNAGIAGTGLFEDVSLESWGDMLDTNLWSVIYGCRTFLPLLKQSGGGHIVNVASAAGLYCAPGMIHYNVAKAGAIAVSETLRAELAPDNIGVTASCAEFFQSGLLDAHKGDSSGASGKNDPMQARAKADVAASAYSSTDIARHTISSIAKGELYSLPMRETRLGWLPLRLLPETGRALLAWMYRKQLWKFAPVAG
jgi:NAD(P)-dependent dehydrogenase (short-subunit alcohol dehydrogenase family)